MVIFAQPVRRMLLIMSSILMMAANATSPTTSPTSPFICESAAACAKKPFWHIPGANPILTPSGQKGSFDSHSEIEAAGVGFLEATGEYYLFHHGDTNGSDYQLGVAFAKSPLGPWVASSKNPILPYGKKGDFDEGLAACGHVSQNATHWQMMYCGGWGKTGPSVGLAIAAVNKLDPELGLAGPWEKVYPGGDRSKGVIDASKAENASLNKWPYLKNADGFYVGTVMQGAHTGGEMWMYAEGPVGLSDQGPIALWHSPSGSAEGPWKFKVSPAVVQLSLCSFPRFKMASPAVHHWTPTRLLARKSQHSSLPPFCSLLILECLR
jgi:hypothetical protein